MRFGVIFPQAEIGDDPGAIRDYAQAVEAMGFEHILMYDHVLGNDPANPRGPYSNRMPFHEPFVLFGFFAAVTTRIELATGVIILPQRQTVLVAKQVAEADILSGGRVRLGIGTGWNRVEYEALAEDFHNRGRRQEEQVELMRRLWSEDVLDYTGRWHRIDGAGINPRPARSIPIWFGGRAEAVLKRAARLGDGWVLNQPPTPELRAGIARLRDYLAEQGRDPEHFGIEATVNIGPDDPERWRRHVDTWCEFGATHVSVGTMGAGYEHAGRHIEGLRRWREAVVGSR